MPDPTQLSQPDEALRRASAESRLTRPQFEALRTAEPIAEWQDLPTSHPLASLKDRRAVVAPRNTITVLMRLGLVEIAEGAISEGTGRPYNQINALTSAGETVADGLEEGGELPLLDHIARVVNSASDPGPQLGPGAGDLRQLLTRLADRLTENLPDAAMREVNRLAYAQDYAESEHGRSTDMARAVERALLRQMPRIDDRPITRGEYALLLHARAGRSTRAERVAALQREAIETYTAARPREDQARAALVYARIDGNASA